MNKIDVKYRQDLPENLCELLVPEHRKQRLLTDRKLQHQLLPAAPRVDGQPEHFPVPGCHKHVVVLHGAADQIPHVKLCSADMILRNSLKIQMQEVKQISSSI